MVIKLSVLEVEELVSGYGDMEIIQGISFEVDKGETACLIGPNGAGKTTLFQTIFGLVQAQNGSIKFWGEEIIGMDTNKIMRENKDVSYVPEEEGIFSRLSVEENLKVSLSESGIEEDKWGEAIDEIVEIFPRLGERLSQEAGSMSGGEQKMLSLAGALVTSPKLLLIDEISLGLQPSLVREFFDVLEKQSEEEELTIFIADQNAREALGISDFGYVLEGGKIRREGSAEDLFSDEEIASTYLGFD